MKKFSAPWGLALILSSLLGVISCVFLGGVFWTGMKALQLQRLAIFLGFLPSLLILGAFFYSIFGYSVSKKTLYVHRFFWKSKISLGDLVSAEFVPHVMSEGMRVNGNGGFFSFSGDFKSKALGTYKAYVTDLNKTVVLKFKDKNIVVSPEPADEFVAVVKQ